ncbi:tyrosine-type recombinase/integrase [Amnibacterium kyonggiense]|uniref:Site-specific recombinase XerD n=1 Tax=Amnibacterium kyonggiense TaxID=595671 RepID=A0A4R7FP53_9MICO|nr:tyrosine-type recombinase/integrase [Amnibacterium kyonggiense]TDS79511.1 site-specific recombinase XerD [Amnibacterium kyonggiense]
MERALTAVERAARIETPREQVCEGRNHDEGLHGHSGPARFLVRIACPMCGYGHDLRLCVGRVLYGLNSGRRMFCDGCEHEDVVAAFWTIEDLPAEEPMHMPSISRWRRRSSHEIEQSVQQWLATWELRMMAQNCTKDTITERLTTARAFLRTAVFEGEPLDLSEIRTHELLRFISRTDLKPSTRATYRSTLTAFFRFLVGEGAIEHDPTARLPRVRFRPAEPDPVRTIDMQRLLDSGIRGQTITKVLLYAYEGLRASEIAAIKGEDIDWERGRIWVAHAKGGRPVWRPLHPLVLEHIQAQDYPRVGYWFPSYRIPGPVTGSSVSDTISKAMKRAGIPHRPHDLRKWHGTTLLALGADSIDVQHSLRHVDGQSMKAYVLPNEERITAAKQRLPRVEIPTRPRRPHGPAEK